MKRISILFLLFFLQSALADDLLTSNVQNGCSGGLEQNIYLVATFTLNQYTCNPGYYLPANTDHCVICPDIYDCSGGTFYFNKYLDQGNKFKLQLTGNIANGCKEGFLGVMNNASNITATFVPNQYTCNAGYYLPANAIECTQCPENSYCPGGTLTFNETTPDGIFPCPNNQTSLPGSSSVDQCKTISLNWVSNGETYTATSCTINDLVTLPNPPTNPGYTFTGWKLQTNN